MRAPFIVCVGTLGLALSAPAPALALECFQQLTNAAPLASDPAARGSTTLPVTLASTFRTNPACDYGLNPALVSARPLALGETDFATVAASLAPDAAGAPPRSLYARARREGAPLESVFRAQCTTALLGPAAAFDLRTATGTRLPLAERVAPASCAAERLELRFVPTAGAERPTFTRDLGRFVLPAGTGSVTVETTGDFLVYAARSVAGNAPRPAAMLIGAVRPGDPLTPLRRAFARSPEAPWLRADWGDDGALTLRRGDGLRDEAWAEWSTAAAADALWLAEVPDAAHPATAPKVHGSVRFVGPEGGDGVSLPPRLVDAAMRARFGPAGARMVPTLTEWRALLHRLQVCLAPSYPAAHAPPPDRLPPAARCARLANVMAALSLPETATPRLPRQLCVQRSAWRMRASTAEVSGSLGPACVSLPAGAAEDARDAPTEIVSVGDRVAVSGDAAGLYACIDNTCRVLRSAEEDGVSAWRSGLLEVRRARSLDAAMSSEGLTLARMVVIDPARDWLPAGLVRAGDAPAPEGRPWAGVAHDEPAVFAWLRRVSSLSFGVVTSETAAAAWNAPGAPTLLGADLPVVGGLAGTHAAPPPSGLVVLVRRDARCPAEPAGEVRRNVGVNPDALLPDQEFSAHLARYRDDASPYECLATARFRVRERRALTPAPWARLGLLGDTQWAFFLVEPFATGVVVPVAYAAARIPYGFRAEAAVNATAAVAFDDAALTRAGAGVSLSMSWGPEALPRLLTVGAMLHFAGGTRDDEPWVSPYAALNLSSLVDLAGGR